MNDLADKWMMTYNGIGRGVRMEEGGTVQRENGLGGVGGRKKNRINQKLLPQINV